MQRLEQKLKNNGFVFSNECTSSASYIFEDGSFLNLNEQSSKFEGPNKIKNYFHGLMDTYIKENNLLTSEELNELKTKQFEEYSRYNKPFIAMSNYRFLKSTDNAIVINTGSGHWENCYIDLPATRPTQQQLNSLTTWIDSLTFKSNKRCLWVSRDELLIEYDLDKVIAENIIFDINKIYNQLDSANEQQV